MGREFRVLRAVHPRFPEAPKAISFCEDPAVLGTPFFLMERRRGVVLRDVQPADPRRVSQAFVDCLIRLHAVDISVPEIGALGRPDGFVERQVRGWAERWRRAQTTDVPGMEGVIGWLAASIPPQQAPVLLHNDFKLDNVMLNEAGHGVATVLDWEMATLGDPLADLGLALCYWTNASTGHAITTAPGWYTREEFVERYAAATGRSMRNLAYYEVLGIFKLAVILQQIYFRFHRRQTSDERFRHFDLRVRELVELAVRRIDRV
jgi:aminoglycoside phosphotransferase (APT) family kinase protein